MNKKNILLYISLIFILFNCGRELPQKTVDSDTNENYIVSGRIQNSSSSYISKENFSDITFVLNGTQTSLNLSDTGFFILTNLKKDTYILTISKPNYKTVTIIFKFVNIDKIDFGIVTFIPDNINNDDSMIKNISDNDNEIISDDSSTISITNNLTNTNQNIIYIWDNQISKLTYNHNYQISGNINFNTPVRIDPVTITVQNDNGGGKQTYSFQIVLHRAHPTERLYIWRAINPQVIDTDLQDLYNDVLREPPPDPATDPQMAIRFPNGKPIMGIFELDDNNKVINVFENIDAPSWTFDPYTGRGRGNGIGIGNLFFNEFDCSIDDSAISALNGVTNVNVRNADNVTGNGDGILSDREMQIINRVRDTNDRLYGRLNWRNQHDWADSTLGDPNNTTGYITPSNNFIIDTSKIDGYTDNNNPEWGYLNTSDDIRIFIPDTRLGQIPDNITFYPDCSKVETAPDFEADNGNLVTAYIKSDINIKHSHSIKLYDYIGNLYSITLTFEKMYDNKWMWSVINPTDNKKIAGFGTIEFDNNGDLLNFYNYQSPSDPRTYDRFVDTYKYGNSNLCLNMNLDKNLYVPDFDSDGTANGLDINNNNVDDGLEAAIEMGVGTDQNCIAPNSGTEYDEYIYDIRTIGFQGIVLFPNNQINYNVMIKATFNFQCLYNLANNSQITSNLIKDNSLNIYSINSAIKPDTTIIMVNDDNYTNVDNLLWDKYGFYTDNPDITLTDEYFINNNSNLVIYKNDNYYIDFFDYFFPINDSISIFTIDSFSADSTLLAVMLQKENNFIFNTKNVEYNIQDTSIKRAYQTQLIIDDYTIYNYDKSNNLFFIDKKIPMNIEDNTIWTNNFSNSFQYCKGYFDHNIQSITINNKVYQCLIYIVEETYLGHKTKKYFYFGYNKGLVKSEILYNNKKIFSQNICLVN